MAPEEERSFLAQKILETRWLLNKLVIWPILDLFEKPLNRLIGIPTENTSKSSMSVNEAKKFLSQRILETAHRDVVDFDNLEEKMLYWTAEHEDMDLADKFAEKHNDDDYEKKVIRLLKSSYEHDHENGSIDLQKYNDAYAALFQGDHYLTVLLDQSIGNQISPPGSYWLGGQSKSIQDYVNLALTGFVIMVVFISSTFAYFHFFGK
jgi:hypothetical protein